MTTNLFKAIDKYLKLRTIRILREKYLPFWSCVSVRTIMFAKVEWYRSEVCKYASLHNTPHQDVMFTLAFANKTSEVKERLKFLNYLEDLVLKGKA